jgi:hypothetical protein
MVRTPISFLALDRKYLEPDTSLHPIEAEGYEIHPDFMSLVRELNFAEVVKKEVLKLLKARVIYPISDSEWVSLVQVVPKKGGMTVIRIEKNEPIPQRIVTG